MSPLIQQLLDSVTFRASTSSKAEAVVRPQVKSIQAHQAGSWLALALALGRCLLSAEALLNWLTDMEQLKLLNLPQQRMCCQDYSQ